MTTTSAHPISRFLVAELADAPEDLRTFMQEVADKTGFVPNIFLALLHRPEECRAFIAYYTAVMDRRGGLTPTEKEMIVVATSAAWGCPYCVVAHSAVLRIRAKDPLIADYLATNYRAADITDRQRAMLDYCLMLSPRPQEACGARSVGMTISLRPATSKGIVMDASAKITSKGQVTIPRSVREALDLHEGDEVVFRVEETRAVLAKTPNFLSLAASVAVPAARRGTPWDDVLRRTRRRRWEARR